ncbi:MAG: hypothetical protein K2N88_05820, partial [Muribaculaceae bacterium]|nr:hypothetical protein [Muribaculaceae bacterium]
MKKIAFLFSAAALLASCAQKNNVATAPQPEPLPVTELSAGPALARLKASVFKMSGNYSDNVAVTLDSRGNLVYYPAPTDISAASRPVEIGEGWWLNRQGLGERSVFTRWTFDEYSKLPAAPSPEEIKAAILPGATVTEFRVLAIPASDAAREAASDPTLLL